MVPDQFKELITAAGFDIDVWSDKTDLAQKAFAHMKEPVGEPELPELGVHLLVGNDILTKAYNLSRNLNEERVSLIETVGVNPKKNCSLSPPYFSICELRSHVIAHPARVPV